jgi:hypothetical protein
MHLIASTLRRATVVGITAGALWGCPGPGTGSGATDASVCQPPCERSDAGDADDAADAAPDATRSDAGDAAPDAKWPDAGPAAPDASDPLADGGCVGTSSKGERLPLDMYVMLDQSGSMNDGLSNGSQKWTAVSEALLSFLAQPGMEGVSVGLQYFPLPDGRQCPSIQLCAADSDCTCGPCLFPLCVGGGGASCDPKAYAATEVEIAPMASAAASLRDSIGRHSPAGGTPTSAALQGAIDHARAWASDPARSNHVVIVVLATDGLPTDCDLDLAVIGGIAAGGANQSPTIRTFVIGVGEALDNLNGIAQSGGTTSAIIVDTAADVNLQFLDALNRIRGTAIGCSYVIPSPMGGQQVDYDFVNVRYQPGNGAAASSLVRVQSAAACAGKSDAWYYDDPAAPKQILLCPETCTSVESDATGEVDVVLGCKTIGPN